MSSKAVFHIIKDNLSFTRSAEYYFQDSGEIDPDYYENYPNGQYKRRRTTKATKRCKNMRTGEMMDCEKPNSRSARDQTSWMVEPAGPAGERNWF